MSATNERPPARVPVQRHGFVRVLDDAQVADAVAGVDELVASWTRREMSPVDFFTLGAASYLDATTDLDGYTARAAALNPALRARFGVLYGAVIAALEEHFGACEVLEPLALPGFHIFGHRPAAMTNRITMRMMEALSASVHADRQFEPHTAVWGRFADVDLRDTMTFTLALELPSGGAGLYMWGDDALRAYEEDGPFVAHVRAIDHPAKGQLGPPIVIPYRVGSLFYFLGDAKHQIAPSRQMQPSDRRITLQGHGTRCDGVWRLYF